MSAMAQSKESGCSDSEFQTTSHSERFDQNELSDLIRDLNFSKDSSELLASRLKEKNVLQPGTKITFYRRREKDLLPFYTKQNNLVFCNDFGNLLKKTGLSEYNPSE
jgi:DNA gyrase/topoisomerase IV subunit B